MEKKDKVLIVILIILIILGKIVFFIINHGEELLTVASYSVSLYNEIKANSDENTTSEELEPSMIVTSLDGIEVPVPPGFVASSVEDEQYVNGLNIDKKAIVEDLTLSIDESQDYPWEYDSETSVWISGNKGVKKSSSILDISEFTIGENGGMLSVEWSVNSNCMLDSLYIELTNIDTGTTEICLRYNNTWYGLSKEKITYMTSKKELLAGTYTAEIIYNMEGSGNIMQNSGYVKNAKVYKYDDRGEETLTIHQYGGFVIYEGTDPVPTDEEGLLNAQKTRNQWVWVPVPDVSRICSETDGLKRSNLYSFNKDGITDYSRNSEYEPIMYSRIDNSKGLFKNWERKSKIEANQKLEKEYEETIRSIEEYGGFYIGRYETGNANESIPVIQKQNTSLTNMSWNNMHRRIKRIAPNSSVKTSMIWGCLWDETLQWMIDSGTKTIDDIKNSVSWGNYYDSAFTYIDSKGNEVTKSIGSEYEIPTGGSEYTKSNNIYDMAGNLYEWTLEADKIDSQKITRGGSFRGMSDCSVSIRGSYKCETSYYDPYIPIGFRACMLITPQ